MPAYPSVVCPACGRRVGRLPDGTPETHSRPDVYDTACNGDAERDGKGEVMDDRELPSWLLRQDAPSARCGRCKRYTWDESLFGQEDQMTQPDGHPCGGIFVAVSPVSDPTRPQEET